MVRFNLPWDLVEEILSRVPATYLRGLQFTCKRWNALFKDPEFIKKHSDKAAKPPYSILLFSCSRVYSLSVNINNIAVTVGPTKLSRNPNESSEEVEITQVVHCNGLLLCSTKESNMAKLVVVNPCTGQARWIKPRSVYDMSDRYALGYENNNNQHSYASYKILRFPADGRSLLEIFELKSNSWRVLANIPLKGKQRGFGRGVSLKGNTYWLSCFLDDFEILSYDFATERFIILSFPFILPLRMSDSNTLALSVVREEQLSVLHLNLDTKQMEIWVSNKIDDDTETALSWSKSFEFDLYSHFDLSLLKLSFFIDEEKKVIVSCGRSKDHKKKMIYIVGEHDCRTFNYSTSDQPNPYIWFLFSYVPSLVSLNPPI